MAALELAIIAPVLLTLLLGTVDLSNAILTARRMEIAATAIAQMASTDSSQTLTLNQISDVQATAATSAAFAFFPEWARSPGATGFAVTLSGISFTGSPSGCTQSCTYKPAVVWSVANPLGLVNLRACGSPAIVPDTQASDYPDLPIDDVGATSLFVADVKWTFTPMFFGFLFQNIPMFQSAVVSPRIGNGTALTGSMKSGFIERC